MMHQVSRRVSVPGLDSHGLISADGSASWHHVSGAAPGTPDRRESPVTHGRPPVGSRGSIDASKFKTKLCRNFTEGICQFGENCAFVHHPEEVRPVVPDARKQGRVVPQAGQAGQSTVAPSTAHTSAVHTPTSSAAPSPFPSPMTSKSTHHAPYSSPAAAIPAPRSLQASVAAPSGGSTAAAAGSLPPPPPPSYDVFVSQSSDVLMTYSSATGTANDGGFYAGAEYGHSQEVAASAAGRGMLYMNGAHSVSTASLSAAAPAYAPGSYQSPTESDDDETRGFARRYRYEPYSPIDSVVYVA